MLFDAFKSAPKLEVEIRDWYFQDLVRVMGKEEAFQMKGMAYERDIKEVVSEVAATATSNYESNKMLRAMAGSGGTLNENVFFLRGINLVQSYAKKRKWKIFKKGSPAMGYEIEIMEIP